MAFSPTGDDDDEECGDSSDSVSVNNRNLQDASYKSVINKKRSCQVSVTEVDAELDILEIENIPDLAETVVQINKFLDDSFYDQFYDDDDDGIQEVVPIKSEPVSPTETTNPVTMSPPEESYSNGTVVDPGADNSSIDCGVNYNSEANGSYDESMMNADIAGLVSADGNVGGAEENEIVGTNDSTLTHEGEGRGVSESLSQQRDQVKLEKSPPSSDIEISFRRHVTELVGEEKCNEDVEAIGEGGNAREKNHSAFFLYTVTLKEKTGDIGVNRWVGEETEEDRTNSFLDSKLELPGSLSEAADEGSPAGGSLGGVGGSLGGVVLASPSSEVFLSGGSSDVQSSNSLIVDGSDVSMDYVDGFVFLSASSCSVLEEFDKSKWSMEVENMMLASASSEVVVSGGSCPCSPSYVQSSNSLNVDGTEVEDIKYKENKDEGQNSNLIQDSLGEAQKGEKEKNPLENVDLMTEDDSFELNNDDVTSLEYKCRAEMKIDKLVAQRNELFKQTFMDIKELKHEIIQGNPAVKKCKEKRKKKSVEEVNLEEPRRSARDLKRLNYNYDKDWEPSSRRRGPKKAKLDNETLISKKSLRPNRKIDYNFEDDLIFCERCQVDRLLGCEIHPVIFDYKPDVVIGVSKAGRNAGRGVFNNGSESIPEGALLGPYTGIFYDVEEHNLLTETNGETGFAWQLKDRDKKEVIGYIDPGPNPDPKLQYLALVNCAVTRHVQNLVAVQFQGKMYYQAIKKIPPGSELVVYYGENTP